VCVCVCVCVCGGGGLRAPWFAWVQLVPRSRLRSALCPREPCISSFVLFSVSLRWSYGFPDKDDAALIWRLLLRLTQIFLSGSGLKNTEISQRS